MHTNILAVLYFIAGYFAAFCMIFTSTEIHVRAVGSYLVIYLTYMLIEQLEL
jgi:hypothetical protein